jgi:proline iminopeptidase
MKSALMKIILTVFLYLFFTGCTNLKIRESGNLLPPTADQDTSLPQIILNGCTFHLETYGNSGNPAILFLHGGLADYRPLLRFNDFYNNRNLSEEYFLIFYDQRGKGLSQRFDIEDISFAIYLEDMEAIINHFCGDKSLIIISHSFGGIFTAQYMNTHPERILGAVFLEPGAFKSSDVIRESRLVLTSEWINDLMWCQQFIGPRDHLEADFNFTAVKCQEIQPEMHTSEMTPFFRVGVAAQNWLDIELHTAEFDFTNNLDKVNPKILFIAGSETENLGAGYQKQKLHYFSSAELKIIPGAGHGDLIWSAIDRVLPVIFEYLDSLKES